MLTQYNEATENLYLCGIITGGSSLAGFQVLGDIMRILIIALCLCLQLAVATAANVSLMPIRDLRPGMQGIGKTVIQGDTIEEFNVEILGVQGSEATGYSVFVRLYGDLIEKTGGVAQGMSGSPVYVDGRVGGAVALGEGSYGKFSGARSCVWQSSDCKYTLVSDGTNVIYLYSPTAEVAALKIGEAVKPGISGKMGNIDGVPCLTIEHKTFGSQMQVQNQRVYLSELTDDFVGKVVKVYGGIINVDGEEPTLTQGETTIAIHGVTLNGFSTTTQNYVEVIGVIGKDGNKYVIQPISVVASIFTADENITTDRPHVTVVGGNSCIEGNWRTTSVYDSEGRLVAKDRAVLDCSQGVFIVTADNRTIAKVLIRE